MIGLTDSQNSVYEYPCVVEQVLVWFLPDGVLSLPVIADPSGATPRRNEVIVLRSREMIEVASMA